MGMDRAIPFAGEPPTWEAIRSELNRLGLAAAIRMIDGLPAFPDEMPGGEWRELRLGFPAGMVTLRRSSGHLSCVVWGNADPALVAAWEGLCQAMERACGRVSS